MGEFSQHETEPGPPVIVGVAASASELGALVSFLRALPPGAGLAVVVVVADGAAGPVATEVLAAHALLPVVEAVDGETLGADRVYLAPPGRGAVVRGGALRLARPGSLADRRRPLDCALESIAEDRGGGAVAVVLAGPGGDGALGLKAVGDAGGATFVQDPSSAAHDGRPRSAIATGAADYVLPPDALAAELLAHAARARDAAGRDADDALRRQIEGALPALSEALRRSSGRDVGHYDAAALARRVARRLRARGLSSAADYVALLRANDEEAARLVDELLVGVTSFFRDPSAFEALAREALPALLEGADRPVRIWCAGCATGEEAYSLAMLAREHLGRRPGPAAEVQIFATDIDERALASARRGVYPAAVAAGAGPERLRRFFVRKGEHYQIAKDVREMVLFSAHNVVNDPPFSRLDLISCRNLLLYLGAQLQKQVISLFHYALKPGGFLFLGPSEGVAGHRELFRPVDDRHRISRRQATALRMHGLLPRRGGPAGAGRASPAAPSADVGALMQRTLLEAFAPPALAVTKDGTIVGASGRVEAYLTAPTGWHQRDAAGLAREGVRAALRSALAEAVGTRGRAADESASLATDAGPRRVRVTARPLPRAGGEAELFLIAFEDVGPPGPGAAAGDGASHGAPADRLERELAATRTDLELAVQELEAANEELTTTNDELVAMNEELQSANDELVASKAEAQAANESLSRAKTLLDAVLDALPVGVIIAEPGGRLVRTNRANEALWGRTPATAGVDQYGEWVGFWPETGERIAPNEWAMARALAGGEFVAGELVEIERFDDRERRLIINTAAPVRDPDGRVVAGVVAQLDVTARVRAEAQQRFLADLAAAVEHLADPGETVAAVARLLAEHLGADRCAYAESDGGEHFCVVGDFSRGVPSIVGRYALADFGAEFARLTRADEPYVVVDAEADPRIEPATRDAYRQTNIRAVVSVSFHKQGHFVGGMAVHQARPRAWRDDEVALVRLVAARSWDLIERARAVRRLQESEARYRAAAEALKEASERKDEFLATLAHELRNPLAPIRNGLAVLRADADGAAEGGARGAAGGAAEGGAVGAALGGAVGAAGGGAGGRAGRAPAALVAMMDRQLSQLVHLVDDLLDVSRVTTGKIQLRPERVPLREIVDAAVEMCRPGVDAGGHALSVDLPPEPLVLEADRTRIAQVLTNLLHNACKYTPNGGRIALAAEREGGRVVVRVSDTGIGIPADMLPHVFELFTQVGRSIDRAQGGLGIGLSLVKKLVEMHGGEVTASSGGAGAGSTFAVRLPLAADAARAAAPSDRPSVSAAPGARRVLVVDDNVDAADSLVMLLERAGHAAEVAYNGPDALDAARAFRPDLVFLDIGLPGMDGYEVARALRGDPALADAVLVALTGWGSEDDKRRSKDAGFDHHLTKPVAFEKVAALFRAPARHAGAAASGPREPA